VEKRIRGGKRPKGKENEEEIISGNFWFKHNGFEGIFG
jgi:hypothetical protein